MAQSKLTILEVINQANTPDRWGKHLYPKELLNLIGFASAGIWDYFEEKKKGILSCSLHYLSVSLTFFSSVNSEI